MKRLVTLCVTLSLVLFNYMYSQAEEYNRFYLSPQRINRAIRYGVESEYQINDFGGYDFGLNRFDLGEDIGYVNIRTPFVEIATMARKLDNLQEKFKYEDAKKLINYPPQVRAFLYINKKYLRTKVDCILIAEEELFVLSDDVMESTLCDDPGNKCVRKLVYFLPVNELRGVNDFTVVLKNLEFGQRKIKVDLTQIK